MSVPVSIDPARPGDDRSGYALVKGGRLLCVLPDAGPWSLCHFAGELIAVSAESGPWTVRDGELTALRVYREPLWPIGWSKARPGRSPFA